jgi:histone-lysine N-methyltransferase SETMAR
LKLPDAIRRKRPHRLARGALFIMTLPGPRTARATQKRIQELQWALLEYPLYSPALALSDFHLFGLLEKHLGGKRFADDEEVPKWLRKQ